MSIQQLQAPAPIRRSYSLVWWLLGSAMLALVVGLVIYNVSQPKPAPATASTTKVVSPQAVPDAATHGGTNYLPGYNGLPNRSGEQPGLYTAPVPSKVDGLTQTAPDTVMQGGTRYVDSWRSDVVNNAGAGQVVPDITARGGTLYIDSWRNDLPTNAGAGQVVPDAATHGGTNYLPGYNGLPNRSGEQPGLYTAPVPSKVDASTQAGPDVAARGGTLYIDSWRNDLPTTAGAGQSGTE